MHQNVSFPHKKIKKFSEEGTQFFHRPFPWWERNTLFHTYFSSAPPYVQILATPMCCWE